MVIAVSVFIYFFWHELKCQSSKSADVTGTSYRSDANRKSRETHCTNIHVKLQTCEIDKQGFLSLNNQG